MSVFDKMMHDVMGSLGTKCSYSPATGGETFSISAMPSAQDRLNEFQATSIQSAGSTFEVCVGDLPLPQKGDALSYKGVSYIVKSKRYLDEERLIWLLDCYPA